MDQDKENPLGGMFDNGDAGEGHDENAVEVSATPEQDEPEDISPEDISMEDSFASSEEETMVGESEPMPSYTPPKKKSGVLPILLILLLVIAGGFVFAGDTIMQLIMPEEAPMPMYQPQQVQQPAPMVADTDTLPLPVPPVDEPVSDGSFTDIGSEPVTGDETVAETADGTPPVADALPAIDDASVAATPDVVAPVAEEEPAPVDEAQDLADAIVKNAAQTMPQDGLEQASEPMEQDEEAGKQDLIAKILEESAQDSTPEASLNNPENSKLAEMISGEKQTDPALEILQAEGYSPTAADIIRESVVVRPKVKKLVIVEKNFASSSDRALAEAAKRAGANRNYAAALDLYDDILETDPTNEIALMGRAKTLVMLDRSDEALQAYSTVLDRDPTNREALTNYYGLVGDIDPITATLELENLSARNPKVAEIQGQLGVVYGKMKDPVRAMRAFDKASSLDPSNPLYPYNSAVLADRMMNADKAVSYYQKTLTILKTTSNQSGLSADAIEKRIQQLYSQQ